MALAGTLALDDRFKSPRPDLPNVREEPESDLPRTKPRPS
jgi:hypothetical protein